MNDASFSAAEGWTITGDELIEDGRRAVRITDPETDVRLQAVTLVAGADELDQSCESLVSLQQTQFSNVTLSLVAPIGVDSTTGEGLRCGFTGIRSDDGVANTVTFTLISRLEDSHVLMLRTTVPTALADDSRAPLELSSMSCQASASFGVNLPLC